KIKIMVNTYKNLVEEYMGVTHTQYNLMSSEEKCEKMLELLTKDNELLDDEDEFAYRNLNALNELLLVREELGDNVLMTLMVRLARRKKSKEELDNIVKKINIFPEIKKYFENYAISQFSSKFEQKYGKNLEAYSKKIVVEGIEEISKVEKLLNSINYGEKRFLGTEKKFLTKLKREIESLKDFDTAKSDVVMDGTEEIKKLEEKIKSLEKENLEIQQSVKKRITDRENKIFAEHRKEKMH
ncbi:2578_t:CDS:2, partial [Funneliformis geosporum]